MQSTLILLVVAVGAFIIFLVIRGIARLPLRYERHARTLSPWSSLDQGIDPTLPADPEK